MGCARKCGEMGRTGLDLKVGSGQGVRVYEQSGIYRKNLEGRTEGTEARQGKARLTEQRQERPTRGVYRHHPPSADTRAPRSVYVRASTRSPEPELFPSEHLFTHAQGPAPYVFLFSRACSFGFDFWTFRFRLGLFFCGVTPCLFVVAPDIARPPTFRYSFFTASFVIVLHNHAHRHTSRNLNTIYNQKNRANFTRDRRIDGPNVPSAYKPI